MSVATEQSVENLTVLTVNIHGSQMVLPDAAIAEIIDFQPTHAETDDMPTWYLGTLPWRGLQIPLVSLEGMNHDAFFTQSRSLKIIVMHGFTQVGQMPYWAFVAMETPRMQRIDRNRLQPADGDSDINAVTAMWATLDGETVMLPDLHVIEQQLLQLQAA